eukprot:c8857_g1_i2.p1 GENE.c8857_g1_i2~~c8857_g1_i2.p1  ORF type:complete len:658 (+),score=121.85 c8857_g1_i2:1-1974(+)
MGVRHVTLSFLAIFTTSTNTAHMASSASATSPNHSFNNSEYVEEIIDFPKTEQFLPPQAKGTEQSVIASFAAKMQVNEGTAVGRMVFLQYKSVFTPSCCSVSAPRATQTIIYSNLERITKFQTNGICVETTDQVVQFRTSRRDVVFDLLRRMWVLHKPPSRVNVVVSGFAMTSQPDPLQETEWQHHWCVVTDRWLTMYRSEEDPDPVAVLPLDLVYEIEPRIVEASAPPDINGIFGVVIHNFEQELILAFEHESEANKWHDYIKHVTQHFHSHSLSQVCLSGLFMSETDSSAKKCFMQLDFSCKTVNQFVGGKESRFEFRDLSRVLPGGQNSVTLKFRGSRNPSTILLSSEKERAIWQCVFEGICEAKSGFNLSPELRGLLRPAKMGVVQQYVKCVWNNRWVELMPYGELVVFAECPSSPFEVNSPLEVFKLPGAQVFRRQNCEIHLLLPNCTSPFIFRFQLHEQRESWWHSLTASCFQKLQAFDCCLDLIQNPDPSRKNPFRSLSPSDDEKKNSWTLARESLEWRRMLDDCVFDSSASTQDCVVIPEDGGEVTALQFATETDHQDSFIVISPLLYAKSPAIIPRLSVTKKLMGMDFKFNLDTSSIWSGSRASSRSAASRSTQSTREGSVRSSVRSEGSVSSRVTSSTKSTTSRFGM